MTRPNIFLFKMFNLLTESEEKDDSFILREVIKGLQVLYEKWPLDCINVAIKALYDEINKAFRFFFKDNQMHFKDNQMQSMTLGKEYLSFYGRLFLKTLRIIPNISAKRITDLYLTPMKFSLSTFKHENYSERQPLIIEQKQALAIEEVQEDLILLNNLINQNDLNEVYSNYFKYVCNLGVFSLVFNMIQSNTWPSDVDKHYLINFLLNDQVDDIFLRFYDKKNDPSAYLRTLICLYTKEEVQDSDKANIVKRFTAIDNNLFHLIENTNVIDEFLAKILSLLIEFHILHYEKNYFNNRVIRRLVYNENFTFKKDDAVVKFLYQIASYFKEDNNGFISEARIDKFKLENSSKKFIFFLKDTVIDEILSEHLFKPENEEIIKCWENHLEKQGELIFADSFDKRPPFLASGYLNLPPLVFDMRDYHKYKIQKLIQLYDKVSIIEKKQMRKKGTALFSIVSLVLPQDNNLLKIKPILEQVFNELIKADITTKAEIEDYLKQYNEERMQPKRKNLH